MLRVSSCKLGQLILGMLCLARVAMSANEIELIDASSRVNSYRGPPFQSITADILVKNLSPEKKVRFHFQSAQGDWRDSPARFVHTTGDGRELWQANVYPCNSYYETDCAMIDPVFAVQMEVGAESYWDNNDGANYHLNQQSGYMLAHERKVFTIASGSVQRYLGNSGLYLSGRVLLENLGANKSVKLIYTLNGWKTRAESPLTFLDASQAYPPERFTNPGEFGGEVWSFSFAPPDGQMLEYFIQYSVNGRTYYDSNFGKNYKLAVPEISSMTVRGTPGLWQPQPMWTESSIDGSYAYTTTVDVSGHDLRERFKFDAYGDWSLNFGEADNGGYSRSGVAERSAGDIRFMDGAGLYQIKFANRTHAFNVQKIANPYQSKRTLIFIYGKTVFGQNMFIRGGIDHAYSETVLKKPCKDTADYLNPCSIPVRSRVRPTQPDFSGDGFLDWYGAEPNQSTLAAGSPLTWTTNDNSYNKTVVKDEFGFTPMNKYGEQFWMFDVDMDCSRTVNGWFELKSFISGGPGWEGDIKQAGTPYASKNHFGQCGKINVFRMGESSAQFTEF